MQTYPTSRYRRNFIAMNFSLHHDAKKQGFPAVFAALGTMVFPTVYRRTSHTLLPRARHPTIGKSIVGSFFLPGYR